MIINDIINCGFEAFASVAILNHCRVLNQQKKVSGTSVVSVVFFTAWGIWNMYYYPMLGQTFSAIAGGLVCLANFTYVMLLLKYRKNA